MCFFEFLFLYLHFELNMQFPVIQVISLKKNYERKYLECFEIKFKLARPQASRNLHGYIKV